MLTFLFTFIFFSFYYSNALTSCFGHSCLVLKICRADSVVCVSWVAFLFPRHAFLPYSSIRSPCFYFSFFFFFFFYLKLAIILNGHFFVVVNKFIYLFLAALGLCFCARAFSSCSERGPLFIAVRGPLTVAASLVAEQRLQTRRLSICGSRAQLLRGMWDLPRPRLEPMSPAPAGRLSTTAPPGKPSEFLKKFA